MRSDHILAWVAVLLVGLLTGSSLTVGQNEKAQADSGCRFEGPLVPPTATPSGEATHGAPTQAPGAELSSAARGQNTWRFGLSLSASADPQQWAEVLGAGWYLDWSARPNPDAGVLDYWPMVRVAHGCGRPSADVAAQLAAANPGLTWIIGNEPDVIWQDNLTPEQYAEVYHAYFVAIKRADPSARLAVAGVSQPTPLRLAYLDRVLRAYRRACGHPLPLDVWTVHNYVLREERDSWGVGIPPGFETVQQGQLYEVSDHARLDLFEAHLRAFRTWMARRGYQSTPLALTEFGILMPADYGFPPEMVSDYVGRTLDLLMTLKDPATGDPEDGGRLVQRWAWFSLSDPTYPNGNLADLKAGNLTPVGQAYRQTVDRWAEVR